MARIANEISGKRRVLHRQGVYPLVFAERREDVPQCSAFRSLFRDSTRGLAFRDVYQSAGSGSCGVHRVGNLLHDGTHQGPSVFAENHDRQFAALQVLLVRQICVGREKHLKPSFLGRVQQVAVAQCVPPLCSCFFNNMALQRAGNSSWGSVVKENEH